MWVKALRPYRSTGGWNIRETGGFAEMTEPYAKIGIDEGALVESSFEEYQQFIANRDKPKTAAKPKRSAPKETTTTD